ncbi:MAG: NAD(P)H-hydrate dehydratase [Ignavibacteria bacterium]|nr:NAD(P)H-hydrate dehydratase [Ignavibacteria bacterium]
MLKLFTPKQVRELDKYAIDKVGIPGAVLMENAAINMKNQFYALPECDDARVIAILCGKGNNGGDGYALARHLLNDGFTVVVLSLFKAEELSGDAKLNYNILQNYSQDSRLSLLNYSGRASLTTLRQADVLFDAMLGSGAAGELRSPFTEVIRAANESPATRIAIDIPTGLDAETGACSFGFKAHYTFTLAGLKQGLFVNQAKDYTGIVYKLDIGANDDYLQAMDETALLIEPEDIVELLPEKANTIHKFSAGKLACCCGSSLYPGAAVLSSGSAFYSGSGAVTLIAGSSYSSVLHSMAEPQLVIRKFDDSSSGCITPDVLVANAELIKKSDSILLGCGIGLANETRDFVQVLLKKYHGIKKVIDADALTILAETGVSEYNLKHAILTPHMGEFSTLTGIKADELRDNPVQYARQFAIAHQCTLVLKDSVTVIASARGEVYVNYTGNAGLAKFGSGDVLAGVIASFLSQGCDTVTAAICAVYLHGLAADLLQTRFTEYGYTALQLMHEIPASIDFIRKTCKK